MPERICVFCQREVDAWLPWEHPAAALSEFIVRLDTIGSNVKRFWCPHCRSHDRERHLRLYLDRLDILPKLRGGHVLHVAPEGHLRHYIASHEFPLLIRGDLNPTEDSIQRVDLQSLEFPDAAFDLVICNHVLEHVEELPQALSELYRVLQQGGRLICQTPYSERLSKTFEEPALQMSADRLFFYGQEDHVRLFGANILDHFTNAGFVSRLRPHAEVLPDIDPERYGVNEREPFFDVVVPTEVGRRRWRNPHVRRFIGARA